MITIVGILYATGYNIFPAEFSTLPLELYNIPYRLRDYAWRDRDLYINRVNRTLSNMGFVTYERGLYEKHATVSLYYDAKDMNIFTSSNLRKIQEIENDLWSSIDYSLYCMTSNSSLSCKPVKSLIRYFYGTLKSVDPAFDDPMFSNIPNVLHTALTNNDTYIDFRYFLPDSYTITPTEAYGSITRSELLIGCSLSGDTKCQSDSWKEKTKAFLANNVKEKLEKYLDTSKFDFYYYGYYLWVYDIMQQVKEDIMYAIGCMLFIFVLMIIHTRSLFLISLAVMSIFASFIGTEFIYVVVIGFKYFGFFNILSIFIILGIGADDIFVFYDTWRLTEFSSYPSLAHRLTAAYSKSALSMFVTSLTTCVAFFSTAISPLLATRSFGIFSGLLIMYNYISVIVFFPTVVVMHHLNLENWNCACCEPRTRDTQHNKQARTKESENRKESELDDEVHIINGIDVIPNETPTYMIDNHKPSCNEIDVLDNNMIEDSKFKESDKYGAKDFQKGKGITQSKPKSIFKKQKKIVVFFRDYYYRLVTNKVVRWILLSIFAMTVMVFSYQAAQMEMDNEYVSVIILITILTIQS